MEGRQDCLDQSPQEYYVYCLNWIYINFKILGDDVELRSYLNPATGRWDEPPTPQFGDLFGEVWDAVYDRLKLTDSD